MNKKQLTEELKTKSVRQIAAEQGISRWQVDYKVRIFELDVSRIKYEHALDCIRWLMSCGPITPDEMARLTGYGKSKVIKLKHASILREKRN